MTVFFMTFGKLLTIFIYMVLGFICVRKKVFSEGFLGGVSSFLMTVPVPCLIIGSFQVDNSPEKMRLAGMVFVLSMILIAAGIGIGALAVRLLKVPRRDRAVWTYAAAFSNHVFMGWPIMASLFGQEAIFYAAIANLAFSAYAYTFGVWIFRRYGDESGEKKSWTKTLLTPINVALAIALFLFATGLRLPEPVQASLDGFGAVTTPLAMFYVGTILAGSSLREVFLDRRVYLISFLRLILVPLLAFALARPFVPDPVAYGTIVMGNAMPVATYCAIYAGAYRNNVSLASRFVSVTSVLSLVTLPLFAVLLSL